MICLHLELLLCVVGCGLWVMGVEIAESVLKVPVTGLMAERWRKQAKGVKA